MGYYCRVGQQCLQSLQQENEAFVGGAAIITRLSDRRSSSHFLFGLVCSVQELLPQLCKYE